MLKLQTKPVLLQVIYYMPQHPTLLQEFIWGYDDIIPELCYTHKFLTYWKLNIHAVISDVVISIANERVKQFRHIDEILRLN
jgi:uncharacterized protein Usg